MTIEAPKRGNIPIPPIDREYIEIYPVNWKVVDGQTVKEIFTSRSNEGIPECKTTSQSSHFVISQFS